MAALEKIRKTTPRQLTAMDQQERESLITDSLKDIGDHLQNSDTKMGKIEKSTNSMDAKLDRLDILEELIRDMKSIKVDMGRMKQSIESNKSEIDEVKGNAIQMKTEIEDLKSKLAIAEGAVAQAAGLETKVDNMQQEMEERLQYLAKAVTYQQGMLESTDAKFRATHVIIYGVPEDEITLGDNDRDRVLKVIEETKALINESVGDIKVKRLGELSASQNYPRALHVTLKNHEQQLKILEKAKNLKDVPGCAKVYIKKDLHPTVRHEQSRLRKREKEEKAKSENTGCTIRYDYKQRVLLRNNQIIDRFCPSFR